MSKVTITKVAVEPVVTEKALEPFDVTIRVNTTSEARLLCHVLNSDDIMDRLIAGGYCYPKRRILPTDKEFDPAIYRAVRDELKAQDIPFVKTKKD